MPNTASNWISEIRFDERGRPYRVYLMDGPGYRAGERTYVSPAEIHPSNTDDPRLLTWAAQNKAPGGGFLRGRGQWDSDDGEWDQPINFGNLASAGVGAAIGAPFLAGLFGGGGAAAGGAQAGAGGTLPASSVPLGTAMTATPATAGMVSQGASLGGVAPAAGGNALTRFLRDNAGTVAGVGIPAAAAALTSGGSGSNELPDELKRILAMAEARTRRSDPLHQAAVQMAFGALPTYGRAGINLPKVELP